MKRYKNLSGGVRQYDIRPKSIVLEFTDGSVYEYTHDIPGEGHVREMTMLAERGYGLTTYVNQHVRENYARKLR